MPKTIPVSVDRVRAWLPAAQQLKDALMSRGSDDRGQQLDRWEETHEGEERETVVALAVCGAIFELFGQLPDLTVRPSGKKLTLLRVAGGRTAEVRASVVRSNWNGLQAFNNPSKQSVTGQPDADILIAALCDKTITRCEILGYALRDDPMVRARGFSRPAYARATLRDPHELFAERR